MANESSPSSSTPRAQAKERPLVKTGVITEFGEAEVPEGGDEQAYRSLDPTYVPGFSDLRVERDTQIGQAAVGKRPPHKVMSLPINLRWSKRSKVNGQPDETKLQKAKVMGYTPVSTKDVGQSWLTELPEGATVLPDGTIQKGDTVLMKCSPERAARNQYHKQKLTMDRLGASFAKAEERGVANETTEREPIQLGSQLKLPT